MVRFVTFEGGEGSGKTTQIRALQAYLEQLAHPCLVTREPGGTTLGELIRKILLEVGDHAIDSSTELFLYLADRSHHMKEIIVPALAAGTMVLCDRFTDSTLAYQGYGRGLELNWLRQLNNAATGALYPDLTFLLDCPVDLGLSRTARRQSQVSGIREDRFEREKIEFHEKVRAGFLAIARAEPSRVRIIDATDTIGATAAAIRRIMDEVLAK